MALFSWLCIAGAVHGSVGGISGFGMVAVAALALGVQAGPFFWAVIALWELRREGSPPFPYRRWFHSSLFLAGDALFFLRDGEAQSVKAHWIVGGGYRRDAVEDTTANTGIGIDSVGLLLFVLLPTAIGWVSGVMLAAGARCVHSGELCGPIFFVGSSGGVAMLLFGGLGPSVLVFSWVASGIFGRKTGHIGLLMYLVMMWLFMIVAGSACIHSGGESPLCGPGGEGGGIVMVVIGVLLPCGLTCGLMVFMKS
jgi:hypothetical protein